MNGLLEHFDVFEPNGLIAFGALLMCGVFGGMLANRISWMPTITAFMMFGFLFGPHGLNLIGESMLKESEILIDIALGLILYKLGNALHPAQMLRSRRLFYTSLSESGMTFLFVSIVVFLSGYGVAVAAIIGAIAISSSPAVLVHIAEELDAKGPQTDRALSLVAINNLLSFILFTLAFPFVLWSGEWTFMDLVILPVHRLATGGMIGVAVAWSVVQIAKWIRPHDERYRFAVVVGGIILALGLSKMLHASMLISTLSLGIATRLFERRHFKLSHMELSEGGELFFIILFVMAGAEIDIKSLFAAGMLPFFLIFARAAGKLIGVCAVKKVVNFERRQCVTLSLLLFPMAGMAIGLSTTLRSLVPEIGAQVSAMVFAMVAIFETIGPFVALRAFRLSGEIGLKREKSSD